MDMVWQDDVPADQLPGGGVPDLPEEFVDDGFGKPGLAILGAHGHEDQNRRVEIRANAVSWMLPRMERLWLGGSLALPGWTGRH